jgi:hypothetical protein
LSKTKAYSTEIAVFAFFALLSFLVTFPTIAYLRTYVYARLSGDSHSVIWTIWYKKFFWTETLAPRSFSIVASPFRQNVSYPPPEPLIWYPIYIVSLLTNEIVAYNILAILSFLLSAVAVYYLVFHLTKNRLASIISGVVYAFSPYHFAQSYAHMGLSNIQWLPVYLLFLLRLHEARTVKNAVLCALSFSLIVLSSAYYAYFVFVFTVVLVLLLGMRNLIKVREIRIDSRTLKLTVAILLTLSVMIVPFALPTFYYQYGGSSPHTTASWEVESLTARIWSYTIPAVDNAVFGSLARDFIYTQTNGRYPDEHIDYLGYTALALALLGVMVWLRRKRGGTEEAETEKNISFAVFVCVVMFLIAVFSSAPPFLRISGAQISMPSRYLNMLAPMFRSFVRFGVVAMLAVSVLAGIGAKFLLENINSSKKRVLLGAVLIVMALAEFINVPPSKATDVSPKTVPPVYKWLASKPGDFTIAEYPPPVKMPHKFYAYMFYQRIHRKKLADPSQIPPIDGKDYLYNLLRPGVSNVLSYLGVKYVIVHTNEYRGEGGSVVTLTEEHGLRLAKTFPDTLVYEVAAKPSKVLWIPEEGFFAPEFWGGWENHQEWKWMTNEANLSAINFTGRETYGNLRFLATPLGYSRTLEVFLNKRFLKEVKVSPEAPEVVIEDIRLKPGENDLIFSTSSPPGAIDSFLHNGDVRSATFRLYGFRFEN